MSEHLKAARIRLTWHSAMTLEEKVITLRQSIHDTVLYLEAQEQSQPVASSPTTASPTTEALLAAETLVPHLIKPERLEASAMASTEAATPLLQRLRGVLTEAELTSVERCSVCQDRLAQFLSSLVMHAQGAHGTTSTSAKPESKPYAGVDSPAQSPSSESSEYTTWVTADRLTSEDWWLCAEGEHYNAPLSTFCGRCGTARPTAPASACTCSLAFKVGKAPPSAGCPKHGYAQYFVKRKIEGRPTAETMNLMLD